MDNILSTILSTPKEAMTSLAERAKTMRLVSGLTQTGLEKRSGVSLGSIKRFENSGQVSLESLLKIAMALGNLDDFERVFIANETALPSIDALMKEKKKRKRGSIK